MSPSPREGALAPDFELDGTGGRFRLSDHRGSRVVLLFYPGDETPVCTKQFCSYRDAGDDFAALDAVVVGISDQSVGSHERFTAAHGLNVPLLADEGAKVAKAFGVATPIVAKTRRAVIIVDESGVIRFRHVHALGLDFLRVDELREALAGLPAPGAVG